MFGLVAAFVTVYSTNLASASAIQVTQIYTQGAFIAVMATGFAVVTYVATAPGAPKAPKA
jgi:hypothetical protein